MSGRYWLQGSFTVEAAYTMAITFLAIALMLRAAFGLHDVVLGTAVLNEAVELKSHLPERGTEEEQKKIMENGERRLEDMLSQKRWHMKLKRTEDGVEGSVQGFGYHSLLRERGFHPEKLMRRLTLLDTFMPTDER